MEFQSYYGSSNLLWNSIAVERISGGSALGRARQAAAMEGAAAVRAIEPCISCCGIPEPIQMDNRMEFTSRYTSRRRVECSAPPAIA
jgi:hypothetical protein